MAKQNCEIVKVSPEMATKILNGNEGNRPIRDARVEELVRSINEKRWRLTNDAIAMTGTSPDKPGRLLNGQHRMFACVESGKSIDVLVLYGADEDAYAVMDTGAKRSASDLLPRPYQNERRGATQFVFCYERAALSCTGYNLSPGNDEILAEYNARPTIGQTVDSDLAGLKRICNAVSGQLGAFAVLRAHDRAKADAFIERVLGGHGLAKDSPELTLRNRFILEASGNRGSARRPTAATYAAMVIKAWNAVETKAPLTKILFREGEAFPRIVDIAKQPPRVLRRIGRAA